MKLVHFVVAVLSLSFVAATAVRADTACTPYEQKRQHFKDDRNKWLAQKKEADVQVRKCNETNPAPAVCGRVIRHAKELGDLLAATADYDSHFANTIASCQRDLQANCNKMRDAYYALKHRRDATIAGGVAVSIFTGGTSAATAAVMIEGYEAAMHKEQGFMRGIGCSNTP